MTRRRPGFGTTTTMVLVILGIALFFLILQNFMAPVSYISIGRAYSTAQLLRVGRMSLDEAFVSPKGIENLRQTLLKSLVQESSKLPTGALSNSSVEDRNRVVEEFLNAIYFEKNNDGSASPEEREMNLLWAALPPTETRLEMCINPGPNKITVPGAYWTKCGVSSNGNGNIQFANDPAYNSKYHAETVDLAYKQEITNGILKVDDVELRVVAFRHMRIIEPSQTLGKGDIHGKGLVRARTHLTWILPKEIEGRPIMMDRTLVEDRLFSVVKPLDPVPGAPQEEWKFEVGKREWQRGTVDKGKDDK